MRAATLALSLLCVSQGFGEVHMRILREKKLLGYATLSQRISADGGKVVEMRMDLIANGAKHKLLHKTSSYDKAGHPTRMVLETSDSAREVQIVTFDANGANMTHLARGVTKDSTIGRSPAAPWADPSEFWFIRDHPKTGQAVETLLFSIDQNDWILTEIKFLGRREITSGGIKMAANAIETTANGRTSTAYLNDEGDPVALDIGDGVTMELIPTK